MKYISFVVLGLLGLFLLVGCTQSAPAAPASPTASPALGASNASPAAAASTPSSTSTSPASERAYTLSEVGAHATQADCWVAVSGSVYNITGLDAVHPNGAKLLPLCGTDATVAFTTRSGLGPHPDAAQQKLASMKVGTLSP